MSSSVTPLPDPVPDPSSVAKYTKPAFPYLPHGLLALLFLLLYGTRQTFGVLKDNESTFEFLVKRWMTDESATHGWLIIPITIACVWYRRERLKQTPLSSDRRGLFVLGIALLLHLGEIFFDIDGPSALSIPIFLSGAVWYLAGTGWLRELAFPLAYLLFMIPVPGGLTQIVSAPLRLIATKGSKWIVEHFTSVRIFGAGMNMEFMQPYGRDYIRIEIADPCSGIHSLMAIKALHAITAYISRLKTGWKWVLFWCALPITLTANIIRITLLILVSAYYDKTFGLGTFHEKSPYPLFVIVLLLLISLGRLIERLTGGEAWWKARQEKEKAAFAANPIAPYTRYGKAPNAAIPITMAAITLGLHLFLANRTPFQAPLADVHQIPLQAGRWKSAGDLKIDSEGMKVQQADSYIYRVYQRDDNQLVELMVVYRRYGRREFAHRPDYCFPAGGYTQLSKDTTTLPWAGRDDTAVHMLFDGKEVQRMDGSKGLPITTVSYFFASGNRTESDFMRQQLWMALERLMPNKNGWTFVRLVSPRITTDDDAMAAQKDFMKVFEKEIRQVITTDAASAGKEGA